MTLQEVIIKPLITEKSIDMKAKNVFSFKVNPAANKTNIAKAVESVFSVHVEDVRVVCVKRRPKSSRTLGRAVKSYKASFKKAYVRIKAGEKIPVLDA